MSTENELNLIAKKICLQEDIKNYTLKIRGATKKGDGFLGQIIFLSILDKDTKNQLDLVLKKAYSTNEIRSFVPIEQSFQVEIFAYSEIWPKLLHFQNDYGIEDVFCKVPKCYGFSNESPNEYIILQNMNALNYVLIDKKTELDEEHIELIFKLYGRFHGLSYALREKDPEGYSKLKRGLTHSFKEFANSKPFWGNVMAVFKIAIHSLNADEDVKVLDKMKVFQDNTRQIFVKALQSTGCVSTILHGDCWSNNMMFKYKSGKLEDVTLLDWQFVGEGHPVCDLSYILYSGAKQSIIDDYEKYLQIYFDSFKDYIKQFNCDLNKLFTFKQLKDDWKEHCQFGYLMALLIIKIKLTDDEDMKDFSDMIGEDQPIISITLDNEQLNKRFRLLTLHMNEINAL